MKRNPLVEGMVNLAVDGGKVMKVVIPLFIFIKRHSRVDTVCRSVFIILLRETK